MSYSYVNLTPTCYDYYHHICAMDPMKGRVCIVQRENYGHSCISVALMIKVFVEQLSL